MRSGSFRDNHKKLAITREAARNASKTDYYQLNCAGIFVFVVAKPIQNLSALSITDKTVGIRLPRLW